MGPDWKQSLCMPTRVCCVGDGYHLIRSAGMRKPICVVAGTLAISASRTMARLASAVAQVVVPEL